MGAAHISEKEIKRAGKLRRQGWQWNEIAEELGRSSRGISAATRDFYGKDPAVKDPAKAKAAKAAVKAKKQKPKPKAKGGKMGARKISPAEIDKATKLRKDGHGWDVIADKLGRHPIALSKNVRDFHGGDPKKGYDNGKAFKAEGQNLTTNENGVRRRPKTRSRRGQPVEIIVKIHGAKVHQKWMTLKDGWKYMELLEE